MKKPIALSILLIFWPLLFITQSKPVSGAGDSPKNIILMIGDGMGLSQITAGLIANGNKLNLERCKDIGLMKTFSNDNLITDSAAGATAFACGIKTYNGAIGVNPERKSVPTILEIAHQHNLATGLVATSYIQHATPASFFAHQPDRNMYEAITLDLLNGSVDVAIGGGRRFFENRRDSLAVADSLMGLGYEYFYGLRKAKKLSTGLRTLVLSSMEHIPAISTGRGKYLSQATEFAIEKLNTPEKEGFFLMVEGSQIDWGGHANDPEYIITEMLDFDRTIGKVLDFAAEDANTLVIITADHETGGFSVEGGSYRDKEVIGDFTSGGHTATMVPVFAFGPGSKDFTGIFDNTEIFHRMMRAYGFEQQ